MASCVGAVFMPNLLVRRWPGSFAFETPLPFFFKTMICSARGGTLNGASQGTMPWKAEMGQLLSEALSGWRMCAEHDERDAAVAGNS